MSFSSQLGVASLGRSSLGHVYSGVVVTTHTSAIGMSGVGAASWDGWMTAAAALGFSGAGALSAEGFATIFGEVGLNGVGGFSALGERTAISDAIFFGAGSDVSLEGTRIAVTPLVFSGLGALSIAAAAYILSRGGSITYTEALRALLTWGDALAGTITTSETLLGGITRTEL